MTHNEVDSDFTIPSFNDLTSMGEYTITIRSEISVPTDYTQTTFTQMFVEYDFIVIIEPCIVDSYEDTLTAATIEYAIGSLALANVSPFEFTQFSNCGYKETVTTTNLPAFVTHNMATYDFSVPQNSDLTLIGLYYVTLEGVIQVP